MPNRFYHAFDSETQGTPRKADYRTSFQIDRDRIIHAHAFRKLQSKTQVFLSGEYDFYRTRLTHSMEVAQIGRSICQFLRTQKGALAEDFYIDSDLVEGVCLAHDLGHPPFGHSGERTLQELMAKWGGFEGNAQTLHLLTATLYESEAGVRGMQATRALLDGVLKYKKLFREFKTPPPNHFLYDPQVEVRKFVFGGAAIPQPLHGGEKLNSFKSVECQIMDWADDAAYSLNDIVDGTKAGFLTLTVASVFAADAPPGTPAKTAAPAKALVIGDATIVPLWPAGAPGFEDKKDLPEKVVGSNVSGINYPTLTVYLPPRDQATGAAVVVAPGGGHARLAIQHEGYNVGQWLASHGVAAFVLKYRLAKDDVFDAGKSPYTVDQHALADAQRALRLVRSRAVEWNVNPAAVGIIGFSAGGEVALLAAARPGAGAPDATDPIDRLDARPDFFGLLYPGGLPRTDIEVTKAMPPAFLACGSEDRQNISEGLAEFYLKCKRAGVMAELHIYAGTGHGFGVRDTNKSPSGTWPARFRDWLEDRKFLKTL